MPGWQQIQNETKRERQMQDRKSDIAIGQRLRERRELRGISERVAATAIGARSHSTIRDNETGRSRVPASRLKEYARLYECKVQDFYKPIGSRWSERKERRHSAIAPMRAERVIRRFRQPSKMINRRFFISYRRSDAGMSAVLHEHLLARTPNITTGVDIIRDRLQ
jgi:transcriptional regulator with XRE-family HTH domain